MRRSRHRRRGIGIVTPVLVVALAAPAATPAQAQHALPRPDIAADWFAQTITAAGETGFEVSERRVWAIGWLSAQRALDTDHGHPVSVHQRPPGRCGNETATASTLPW